MFSSSGDRRTGAFGPPKRPRQVSRSRFSRWLRYSYIRLVRINDAPHKIAWGLAVGIFLGLFPTFGLGAIVALGLAILFKFNKAAAILGSLIMNPITAPFFWTASSVLGAFLANRDWHRTLEMVRAFYSHLRLLDFTTREGWLFLLKGLGAGLYVYLLGNLLVSLLVAGIFYFAALRLTEANRQKRRSKSQGVLPAEGPGAHHG